MGKTDKYTASNINDPARNRALRLIQYLQALADLRTKIIRDVKDYEHILWLHEIPREKECFTQAWGPNMMIVSQISGLKFKRETNQFDRGFRKSATHG